MVTLFLTNPVNKKFGKSLASVPVEIYLHLGYYSTTKDAFCAYKEFKENLIKKVAREYQDQIDPRVFEALLNYAVEVDD